MRSRKFLIIFIVAVGLMLAISCIISAQQQQRGTRGQSNQRGGRQIDPETIVQQRVDRTLNQLNLSEVEKGVLKPKIEGILRTRQEQNLEMRGLTDELQKALNAKDDEQIKSRLEEVKAKRKEHKAKIELLENELIDLLTVEQEAWLTVLGIINGGDFGGFFLRGPRTQGSGSSD